MKIVFKIVSTIVLLAALVGGAILVQRSQETRKGAAANETSTIILPSSTNIVSGQNYDVHVWINTGKDTDKMAGAEFWVGYDYLNLEFVEAVAQNGYTILNTDLNGEGNGQKMFKMVTLGAEKSGAVDLVKLTFKALNDKGGKVKVGWANVMISGQSATWEVAKHTEGTFVGSAVVSPTVGARPLANEGELCAGIAGIKCNTNLTCKMSGTHADASGTCVKLSCGWCGSKCREKVAGQMCTRDMPPSGYSCVNENNSCVSKLDGAEPTAIPTLLPTIEPTSTQCKVVNTENPDTGYTIVENNNPLLVYQGPNWHIDCNDFSHNGSHSYSGDQGNSYVEFTFTGTEIKYYTKKGPAAGIQSIYLDDMTTPVATFDGYSETHLHQVLAFSKLNLTRGSHKLRVSVGTNKNAASSGVNLNVDFFSYLLPAEIVVPTEAPITGNDYVLNYKVALAGVNASSAKCMGNVPLKISVSSAGQTKVYEKVIPSTKETVGNKIVFKGSLNLTGFTANSGVFALISGPKHIQIKYGVNNQTGAYNKAGGELTLTKDTSLVYDFSGYPLLAGDDNQDGIINGLDFAYIKSKALIHETVAEGQTLKGDLDGNCQVNSNDLNIMKMSLQDKQGQMY